LAIFRTSKKGVKKKKDEKKGGSFLKPDIAKRETAAVSYKESKERRSQDGGGRFPRINFNGLQRSREKGRNAKKKEIFLMNVETPEYFRQGGGNLGLNQRKGGDFQGRTKAQPICVPSLLKK